MYKNTFVHAFFYAFLERIYVFFTVCAVDRNQFRKAFAPIIKGMGEQQIITLIDTVNQLNRPLHSKATMLSHTLFLDVLERLDQAQSGMQSYDEIFELLETADSQPYIYASFGYIFLNAFKIHQFDPLAAKMCLKEATRWIDQAQALESGIIEIDVAEALNYIYADRMKDARMVLDFLMAKDKENLRIYLVEIEYWKKQSDCEALVEWISRAMVLAKSFQQRLRLKYMLGEAYYRKKSYRHAAHHFKGLLKLDKNNCALWHKLSASYFRLGMIDDAIACNRKALEINESYLPAVKLQGRISKENRGVWVWRILGLEKVL